MTRNAATLAQFPRCERTAAYRFETDPDAGPAEQRPFDASAEKILELAVSVLVIGIRGLSETRTEKKVIRAAIRFQSECAASDKIPAIRSRPPQHFQAGDDQSASTEFPATARFHRRIDSELRSPEFLL